VRVPEPGRGIPGRSVYEMMGSLSVGEVTRVVAFSDRVASLRRFLTPLPV